MMEAMTTSVGIAELKVKFIFVFCTPVYAYIGQHTIAVYAYARITNIYN